ncbi:phosphatase PAP2 family protein [Actinokineospora sp. NPDC004072]
MLVWSVAGVVVMVVVGVVVGDGASGVDDWVADRVGGPSALWDTLSLTTHPVATIGLIAVTVVAARRHPRVAAVAAAAPAVAVALNTWVLKPAFGRVYDDHLAYPSGHTTALAAILAVLVFAAGPRRAAVTAPIAAALVVVAGAAIVGMGYHYATDILGAALWAVGVVGVLWALVVRETPVSSRFTRQSHSK